MFLLMLLVNSMIFHACNSQRRIVNGREVKSEKKYMVYLVQADIDPQNYDYWLCGGALVTRSFILTSAACVEDVQYIYAIAGYKKYVMKNDLDGDECIKNTRKKVVYTCVPKKYTFNYDRTDRWAYIDIALAKTEAPFSKNDDNFKFCDYVPVPIPINFETRYQEPGIDCLALGWGHRKVWRQPEDYKNYNEAYLRYASTKITDKGTCKDQFTELKGMDAVIDEYMLCTLEKGALNENGTYDRDGNIDLADGCSRRDAQLGRCKEDARRRPAGVVIRDKSYTYKGKTYNFTSDEYVWFDDGEVKLKKKRKGQVGERGGGGGDESEKPKFAGICQNDHGGPLVTWVGPQEQVIGVASVFKVNKNHECVGPFLFTSTQCNGRFLNCILEANNENARRAFHCDSSPKVKGFDTLENNISWKRHPDGPALNER
ncbi:uncharacterized protein LOC142983445 [Anticarsia gemmatalis]|uniref:uncharacterized protein LOC142983445 n=1 Tax=Anticarsia gemmatalis TaxID=129554 RepID=UPI003F76D80D